MHPEAVFVRAGCVAGALDGASGAIEVLSFQLDPRSECIFWNRRQHCIMLKCTTGRMMKIQLC